MAQEKLGRGKKVRRHYRHEGKRKAALLLRNHRANVRKIERAKRVAFFKAHPDQGSPSQVLLREKVTRAKIRRKLKKIEKGTFTASDVENQ